MAPIPALAVDVDAVTRASQLLDAGHAAAAAIVAERILAVLDPATAEPDEHVITAVGVYLAGIPECHADRSDLPVHWARYAVRACRDLFGLADPHTIDALHRLIWALCMRCTTTWTTLRPGIGLAAAWTILVRATTTLYGPYAAETLDYRHERARALHQLGHCETATTELMRTWSRRRVCHGIADTTILHTIATLLHDCRAPDDDFARMWLRTQLLAVPADVRTRILDGLATGCTPARTVTHRAVCTRPRPAPGPVTGAVAGHRGQDPSC